MKSLSALLPLCAVPALGLAVAANLTGYSYTWDELYSTTAAGRSFAELPELLLVDVHPPLYQVTLRAWVVVAGDAEEATRMLSAAFCMAAVVLYRWAMGRVATSRVEVDLGTAILGSNAFLVLYASETRSYALTLLLSVAATSAFVTFRRTGRGLPLLIASSLALGLTHFFGLAYGTLLLTSTFFDVVVGADDDRPTSGLGAIRRRAAVIVALAAGLIWPLTHVFAGELGTKTGGSFWIDVAPLEGVTQSWAAMYHPLGAVLDLVPGRLVGTGLAVVMLVGGALWCRSRANRADRRLIIVVLAFVAVVSGLDLHTPVSTPRNYIVLAPPFAFVVAGGLASLGSRRAVSALVAVGCAVSLVSGAVLLAYKSAPRHGIRDGVELVTRLQHENGFAAAYIPLNDPGSGWTAWERSVSNHYRVGEDLLPVDTDEIAGLAPINLLILQADEERYRSVLDELQASQLEVSEHTVHESEPRTRVLVVQSP